MDQSGGASAPEPSRRPKPAVTVESAGGRIRFKVDLVPGETNVVSWKNLQKEAKLSKSAEAGTTVSGPMEEAEPPVTSMAPAFPNQEDDSQRLAAGSSRLNNVIERIERMYAGNGSSDDEDVMLDDIPDEDDYDTEDSFIDDTGLDDYFKVDNLDTKYEGYFVHRGKLEHIEPPIAISHDQQPRKRRHTDLAACDGGNKQVKPDIKDEKVQAFAESSSGVPCPLNINIDDTTSAKDPTENELLEEAITDLRRLVDEFQPPAKEVHDPPSQTVKRRLPHEIKKMIARIAGITEVLYGNMPKHVVTRLMDIVGHLMKLRTLKKYLKIMADSGLSARPETDGRVRKIRQEVEEMVKLWIPFMKYKVEKLTTTSNDFRESGPEDKKALIQKYIMNDAIEDKICDLHELYVERTGENLGPQVNILYEELAALWPSGFMNIHGIRYAIHRAKERRRLLSNLMKDQSNITKKNKDLVQKPEVDETQFYLGNLHVSQGDQGLEKLRKYSDYSVPKSFLRIAPPSDHEDESPS